MTEAVRLFYVTSFLHLLVFIRGDYSPVEFLLDAFENSYSLVVVIVSRWIRSLQDSRDDVVDNSVNFLRRQFLQILN